MQIHLNLYGLALLALVNTGCNILHENCAKTGLMASSVRPLVPLWSFSPPAEKDRESFSLSVRPWVDPRTLITTRSVQPIGRVPSHLFNAHPAC